MASDLLDMSVELTRAHLTQNSMPHEEVPNFLRTIHATLTDLRNAGSPSAGATATTAPAPVVVQAAPVVVQAAPAAEPAAPEVPEVPEIEVEAVSKVAPIRDEDISDPAYKGIDPWLAMRISPTVAKKLNPKSKIHPTVFDDIIICLEDGQPVKLLRAYVKRNHNLAFHEYMDKWNLPNGYPTAPPAYLEQKRESAKKSGLGITTRANREKPEANAKKVAPAKVVAGKVTRVKVIPATVTKAKGKPGPKPGARATKKQLEAAEANTTKAVEARGKRRTISLFDGEKEKAAEAAMAS